MYQEYISNLSKTAYSGTVTSTTLYLLCRLGFMDLLWVRDLVHTVITKNKLLICPQGLKNISDRTFQGSDIDFITRDVTVTFLWAPYFLPSFLDFTKCYLLTFFLHSSGKILFCPQFSVFDTRERLSVTTSLYYRNRLCNDNTPYGRTLTTTYIRCHAMLAPGFKRFLKNFKFFVN